MKIKILILILVLIFSAALLALGVKGKKGNPFYYQKQDEKSGEVGSPFESSGSSSRYELIEAVVKEGTLFFSDRRARSAAPDFVEYQGKYFSIFTPGISFIGIPFYLIGDNYQIPQLMTYLTTGVFALLNLILVIKLASKLGASFGTALLSGFIFLFATNAYSYANTLTQHHVSATLILLGILIGISKSNLLLNILLGLIIGIALLVDIPNLIILTPLLIYVFSKHINKLEKEQKLSYSIKLMVVGIILGAAPLLYGFGLYNHYLTGSYFKLAQTIGRSDYFDPPEKRERQRIEKEAQDPFDKKLAFQTRDQLQELHILITSNQRGWLLYSPIVFLGMVGAILAYQNKRTTNLSLLLVSIILTNIIIYSMFGALGGWAFGPRYLIPSTAVLCALIAVALTRFRKNIIFIIIFFVLVLYSFAVNAMGAITTTQVPPKIEAINLPKPLPYTYEYNFGLLKTGFVSSFVYNVYLVGKFSPFQYLGTILIIELASVTMLYLYILKERD